MKIITKSFQVDGMSCASCVKKVETTLSHSPGVKKAIVNLATETAQITFNDEQTNFNELSQQVAKVGYRLRLKENKEDNRFIIKYKDELILVGSAFFTIPLVIPMLISPFGVDFLNLSAFQQLMFATPVQFIFGYRFLVNGLRAFLNLSLNMDVLVATGTLSAYGLSIYLGFMAAQIHSHLYFESSAVIITFVLLGKYLERRAKNKTAESIRSLEALKPAIVTLIKDGVFLQVPLFKIQKDDLILIKPGDRIPVDGIIVNGDTNADESLITGESLPKSKTIGDFVVSGSLNIDGSIWVKTVKIESESMLSKIINLLEDTQLNQSKIQTIVDKVSEIFVSTIILIAAVTLIAWKLNGTDWEISIINAVSVLVIACPCALGLATPTALVVGRGLAARKGILIKDADVFESTKEIKVVVFDKTGTLTAGQPAHIETKISKLSPFSKQELFNIIWSIQKNSTHPFARAIENIKGLSNFDSISTEQIKLIPGKGIQGTLPDGQIIFIGSKKWLIDLGISFSEFEAELNSSHLEGLSEVWIGSSKQDSVLAVQYFDDPIRPESFLTIHELQKLGLSTILLTGDKQEVAARVSGKLKMNSYIAEVLPEDKLTHILAIREKYGKVAMIGDGINDAPALAAADLSMAMGGGTEVAIGASSVTLLKNNPHDVLIAIQISNKTYAKIKQNLFWAFLYNIIGIPLAASGNLNPMFASLAMALSSISVITNSLLLKNSK